MLPTMENLVSILLGTRKRLARMEPEVRVRTVERVKGTKVVEGNERGLVVAVHEL